MWIVFLKTTIRSTSSGTSTCSNLSERCSYTFPIAEHFVFRSLLLRREVFGLLLWSFSCFPLSFWGEYLDEWIWFKLHNSFPWKGTKKNKQCPYTQTDRFRHSAAHLKDVAVPLTNLMSSTPAGSSKSTSFIRFQKVYLIKHTERIKS